MEFVDPAQLANVLLRGSLLLLLAGFAAALLPSAAHRHLALCLGLGAQLVVPVLVLLGPELHFTLPGSTAAASSNGASAQSVYPQTGNGHSTPLIFDQASPSPVVLRGVGEKASPWMMAA